MSEEKPTTEPEVIAVIRRMDLNATAETLLREYDKLQAKHDALFFDAVRLVAEADKLQRENAEVNEGWRLEIQMRDANKYAVVQTVGSTVEGRPTTQHNYLQRLRELMEREAENAELRKRLEATKRELVDARRALVAVQRDSISGFIY